MRVVFAVLATCLVAAGCDRGDKQDAVPAVPAVTPSADEVLEAYVTAMGGRDAFAKVDAMRITGTFLIENTGLRGAMQVVQQRSRRSYQRMEIEGAGVFEEGCDGSVCWEKSDAEGVRIVSGEELEEELRSAMLDSDLRWRELYTKVENEGAVEFEGRPAWKIVLTPAAGPVDVEYYDRATHLQLGSDEIMRGQSGELRGRAKVEAWRTFGQIKQPTRVTLTSEGMTIVMSFDDIEINPAIPAGRFELPPEVKALIDGAKAPEALEAPPVP